MGVVRGFRIPVTAGVLVFLSCVLVWASGVVWQAVHFALV